MNTGRMCTLGWVGVPLGILFPSAFFDRVILRCLEVLPKTEPAWAN
jgi:hypothetical protein